MAKDTLNDYSATASLNTDVGGTSIAEGCSAANINNAIREVMSDIAAVRDGTTSITNWYMTSANVSGTATIGTLVVTTFSPANLTLTGDLAVGDDATITGDLAVTGGTTVAALTASGTVTGGVFIPSSSSAPTNGLYLAAANSPAISSNTTERVRFNASGAWGIAGANYGTAGQVLTSGGSGAAPSWAAASSYNPTGTTTSPFTVSLPINTAANTLMLQSGSGTTNGSGYFDVTFPTAFTIAPRVFTTAVMTVADTKVANVEDLTTTTARIWCYDTTGTEQASATVHWLAFGITA